MFDANISNLMEYFIFALKNMSFRYAVIGTGAIGGYYGGMLANSGKEVHFLFNSDYSYVKENGLKVDSINGNFHLSSVLAYNNTSEMPECDVVLVCLKSTNNKLLKKLLPPLLHKNTLVVLIQNGLGVEADLQVDFPDISIAGGLAFICANKIDKGHVAHFDYGKLNLGAYTHSDDIILSQVCADFQQAGIEAHSVELEQARWMKLVWNIPYNGMAVVLNTETDKLMNNLATKDLLHDMMLEVIRGANIVGENRFSITEVFADQMLKMTEQMKPYAPSMKLDFDSHRPLEIDYIYTRPLFETQKVGFEMPMVGMLEKQLRFIESHILNI